MAMPTDDERREVAAKLRELEPSEFDDGEFYDSWEVIDALGVAGDDGAWFEAASVRRLADLIEPPLQCPYYDSGKHWCDVYDEPAINRDALLKLADAMDKEADAADEAARRAMLPWGEPMGERAARRKRGATTDRELRDACTLRAAALIVREACGEEGR